MNTVVLNLVVLRSPDLERAAQFYSCLGLQFTRHRHGSGPEHFSADLGGTVFELYPLSPDGVSTLGTRVGFRVPALDEAVAAISNYSDAVISPPKDSEWGRRAVVADPDGHRIELLQLAAGPSGLATPGAGVDLIDDLVGAETGGPRDLSARKKHHLKATGYGREKRRR